VLEQGVAKISERRSGSDGQGRHGDSAMAAALAFFASRAEGGKIAYIPAPKLAHREGIEGSRNLFGAPPVEEDIVSGRVRGF
jgi:phage FluMu gp28-like protein